MRVSERRGRDEGGGGGGGGGRGGRGREGRPFGGRGDGDTEAEADFEEIDAPPGVHGRLDAEIVDDGDTILEAE